MLSAMEAASGAEPRDVVVVGGGIAGLSAAWRLRHRDVLLLDAGDRLGGRMRSDPCGEYWLNYGAHLFPAPGSRVDQMARECRLETVSVTGASRPIRSGCRSPFAIGSPSPGPA
jgi:protoporphyrinogen oxidase